MFFKKTLYSIFVFLILSGCSTISGNDIKKQYAFNEQSVKNKTKEVEGRYAKFSSDFVVFKDSNYGQVQPIDREKELRDKALWLDEEFTFRITKPLDGNELISLFREKGVNVVSNIPMGDYVYKGYGTQNLSLEDTLKTILTQMNLDYKINYDKKIVKITPLPWRTYRVNIGSKISDFAATLKDSGSGGGIDFAGESEASVDSLGKGVSLDTKIDGDFWLNIKEEITSKLTILLPSKKNKKRSVPQNTERNDALYNSQGEGKVDASGAINEDFFEEQKIGKFSMNKQTGVIHIQAPDWVHNDLVDYFEEVNTKYNTQITFQGYLFQVTTTEDKSKNLDISSFSDKLQKYGIGYQPNSLGGITINEFPESGFRMIPGESFSSPVAGIYRNDKRAGLLAAYLGAIGKLVTIEEPRVSTTSGVPTMFKNITTEHFNYVTQEAGSGDNSGVATQNLITPVTLGTMLIVNPVYDPHSGVIRVQISLSQTHKIGSQVISQAIGSADSTLDIDIPIVKENNYSGEAVLRDGDTIIIGGYKDNSLKLNDSGSPVLKDTTTGLGSFFRRKNSENNVASYYFALTVKVKRK